MDNLHDLSSLITVTQAAEILNVTRQRVLVIVNQDDDPFKRERPGHEWLLNREAVQAIADAKRIKKAMAAPAKRIRKKRRAVAVKKRAVAIAK